MTLTLLYAKSMKMSREQTKKTVIWLSFYGGTTQTWTGDKGVADLCLTSWLWCHKINRKHISAFYYVERITRLELATFTLARWRSTGWAKSANWCFRTESNHRHGDFQSPALPTELQRQIWRPGTGSNRRPPAWQAGVLTNWTTGPNVVGTIGLEPMTLCL